MYEQSFNPFAQNLLIIKGCFKGKTVLVLAILQILSAVGAVLTAIFSGNVIGSVSNQLLSEMGVDQEVVVSVAGSGSVGSVIGSGFLSIAVTGLIAAAFLIIYIKSNNDDPASSPQAGVSILYILSIIGLVASIISVVFIVLGIILGIALMAMLRSGALEEVLPADSIGGEMGVRLIGVGIVVLIVVSLIVGFFMLFTAVSQKQFYQSVRTSMTSVELSSKGAAPFGVVNIIMAVFSVSSVFGALTLPSTMALLPSLTEDLGISYTMDTSALGVISIVAGISALITLLTYIFQAKLALGYKKYIDDIKEGYASASFAEQPAPPIPPTGFVPPVSAQPVQPQQDIEFVLPTTNAYLCSRCGKQVDADATFCPYCGNKIK